MKIKTDSVSRMRLKTLSLWAAAKCYRLNVNINAFMLIYQGTNEQKNSDDEGIKLKSY